jgi:hypothetical protein
MCALPVSAVVRLDLVADRNRSTNEAPWDFLSLMNE